MARHIGYGRWAFFVESSFVFYCFGDFEIENFRQDAFCAVSFTAPGNSFLSGSSKTDSVGNRLQI